MKKKNGTSWRLTKLGLFLPFIAIFLILLFYGLDIGGIIFLIILYMGWILLLSAFPIIVISMILRELENANNPKDVRLKDFIDFIILGAIFLILGFFIIFFKISTDFKNFILAGLIFIYVGLTLLLIVFIGFIIKNKKYSV
ncbi:MAG: hypothetical protein ACTSRA_21910 [Promethearchaeota archaeon]